MKENEDLMIMPQSIVVYRVGSANTIAVIYSDGKCLVFDCGIDIHRPEDYEAAKTDILKLKPTAIVISHDHNDHHNLFSDLCLADEFELLVKRKTSNERIYTQKAIEILEKKGKTIQTIDLDDDEVVNTTLKKMEYYNTYVYTSSKDKIDNNRNNEKFYEKNETGLILVVYLNDKKVILPADVSYDMWPDNIISLLKNESKDNKKIILVLPHHGGFVISDDFKELENVNKDIELYRSSEYTEFNGNDNAKNHIDAIKKLYGENIIVTSTEEATRIILSVE